MADQKKAVTVGRARDRRYKLTEEDIETIRSLYPATTVKELAARYGVGKTTIYDALDKRAAEKRAARFKRGPGWRKYYSTEKQREKKRRYRAHLAEINATPLTDAADGSTVADQ